MGQSRVFYSMSKDGLLPKVFSAVHPKFRTPSKNNLLFMVFVSLFAAFVPARVVGEMTSIGTLFAFILVCVGVIVLRKAQPDLPRAFKTPLVPLIPLLGVATCLFMMVFLPADTWIRLIVWMLIGFDIYLFYGAKYSLLGDGTSNRKGTKIANITGIILSVILVVIAFLHNSSLEAGSEDQLFHISLVISIFHLILFGYKLATNKKEVS
jgi:APA family basic amino acid/polyamine antiporter